MQNSSLVPVDEKHLSGFYIKCIGSNGEVQRSGALEHKKLKNTLVQLTLLCPQAWDELKATTALASVLDSVKLRAINSAKHMDAQRSVAKTTTSQQRSVSALQPDRDNHADSRVPRTQEPLPVPPAQPKAGKRQARRSPEELVGQPAPLFTIRTVAGEEISNQVFASFEATVLNFPAANCPYSKSVCEKLFIRARADEASS